MNVEITGRKVHHSRLPIREGLASKKTFIERPLEGQSLFSAKIAKSLCIVCGAQIVLQRHPVPQIDAYGFERYEVECVECETPLCGIIDPYDDALLLSARGS